jgi:hypothetical protein
MSLSLKQQTNKRAGVVAWVVEHLPSVHQALGLLPSTEGGGVGP